MTFGANRFEPLAETFRRTNGQDSRPLHSSRRRAEIRASESLRRLRLCATPSCILHFAHFTQYFTERAHPTFWTTFSTPRAGRPCHVAWAPAHVWLSRKWEPR